MNNNFSLILPSKYNITSNIQSNDTIIIKDSDNKRTKLTTRNFFLLNMPELNSKGKFYKSSSKIFRTLINNLKITNDDLDLEKCLAFKYQNNLSKLNSKNSNTIPINQEYHNQIIYNQIKGHRQLISNKYISDEVNIDAIFIFLQEEILKKFTPYYDKILSDISTKHFYQPYNKINYTDTLKFSEFSGIHIKKFGGGDIHHNEALNFIGKEIIHNGKKIQNKFY